MTIYDISEKAGVSIATVSRVLNGSSNVSDKTRRKVLDVIEQYGYTPNAFARGLGLNTMKTIGIMCADSSDLYLAKAVYHIETRLQTNGYDSILSCTGYDPEQKAYSMNLLLSKKVDAIILVGSNFIYDNRDDNQYVMDAAAQVPVMLLNASLNVPNVYSVLTDDHHSMYEATKYLIGTGIQDILYFYNSNSYSGKRKLSGFCDAMEELDRLTGIKRHGLIQFYDGPHEDIPHMAHTLSVLRDRGLSFHGIIAADDALALGAVKYGKEKGLRIPEDLSIIGYNNSMLANCCDPELTSIDNGLEMMCNQLINTLMNVLGGRETPQEFLFRGRLIQRGTTRPIPGDAM